MDNSRNSQKEGINIVITTDEISILVKLRNEREDANNKYNKAAISAAIKLRGKVIPDEPLYITHEGVRFMFYVNKYCDLPIFKRVPEHNNTSKKKRSMKFNQ